MDVIHQNSPKWFPFVPYFSSPSFTSGVNGNGNEFDGNEFEQDSSHGQTENTSQIRRFLWWICSSSCADRLHFRFFQQESPVLRKNKAPNAFRPMASASSLLRTKRLFNLRRYSRLPSLFCRQKGHPWSHQIVEAMCEGTCLWRRRVWQEVTSLLLCYWFPWAINHSLITLPVTQNKTHHSR